MQALFISNFFIRRPGIKNASKKMEISAFSSAEFLIKSSIHAGSKHSRPKLR
jgi:hypothetical protein